MAVRIRFPVFVFVDHGYKTCLGVRDLCIISFKDYTNGHFENSKFIDSDGVLWEVTKINQSKSLNVGLLMHIFSFRRMLAVEIESAEATPLSLQEVVEIVIEAACYVPHGAEEQFDKDEMYYVLFRKKTVKDIINYFSGPLPDFLDEYQVV